MPWRLWRRIKIGPGVTVNLSKSGLSTSLGPRGAKVTLGRGRVRRTLGIPGTGLFCTTTSNQIKSAPGGQPDSLLPEAPIAHASQRAGRSRLGSLGWVAAAVVVLAVVGYATGLGNTS